jgi:hypothetical protein
MLLSDIQPAKQEQEKVTETVLQTAVLYLGTFPQIDVNIINLILLRSIPLANSKQRSTL